MTRHRTSTGRRDDTGASLVLAIVLVLVVGVMAAAVLTATSTGLRVGDAYADTAAAAQDVDGALKAAVNDVRTSTYAYADGDRSCLPAKGSGASAKAADTRRVYYTPTSAESTAGRRQVAVACRPGPSTGGMSEAVPVACDLESSPGTCNKPGNAILTLNPTSVTNEPGLRIDDRLLTVSGRVFSNSTIELNGSPMCANSPQPPKANCVELYSKVPDMPVFARGRCLENGTNKTVAPAVPPVANQPRIFSTPAARCNYGSTKNVYGDDPGYAQPSTSTLTWRSVAPCPNGQATLTLLPGYYDDAAALSDWTDGDCAGNKTVVLSPGTYFFDFKNDEMASGLTTPAVPRGENVWDISGSNVAVVGGEDPDGKAISGPIAPGKLPGTCRSPLEDVAAKGVTMVFGGDSRIVYQSGRVELCGSYASKTTPVVVYGAKTDSADVAPVTAAGRPPTGVGTPSPKPDQTFSPSPSSGGATLVSVLQARDESGGRRTAKVDIGRANNQTKTAALNVTGFTPTATIPAGAILTSALLTVRHQEQGTRTTGSTSLDTLSLTVTPTGGAALPAVTVPVATSTTTFTDFTTQLADELMKRVHDNGFSGLAVELDAAAAARASNNSTWTVNVDQVSLDLTWRLPSVRAQTSQYLGTAPSTTNTTTVRNTSCMALVNGPYVPAGGEEDAEEGASGCALLAATTAGHGDSSKVNGEFYVEGTVYAPGAAVELILPQQNRAAIRSGLVARSVRINSSRLDKDGKVDPAGVSIEVPADSAGPAALDVYFTAYVCSGTSCTMPANKADGSAPDESAWLSAGWQRGGLARAQYSDGSISDPVAGQRGVTISAWQVYR